MAGVTKMEDVGSVSVIPDDIGEFMKKMYERVEQDNPITVNINNVRIVMFVEKRFYDSQYDGP